MEFRKDINGLRALAVIGVVLFHFNESWMPGGFAGVDVFFVISGFLMTKIIFGGIKSETFSIVKFYIARANRIIPALAVLCLVLVIFGWFYIAPVDYRALGKHIASSVGFISNVLYWKESGYFDVTSHEKWLLHTWSLSVEWQFYIIYPLVLVAMRKVMSLKAMKVTILACMLLSFVFGVIATDLWPNFAYYFLPTRAWEMMFGGVAFLYPIPFKDKSKKLVGQIGLILIFFSYLFISKETPWPGHSAILPVLGAFLVIQAQHNNSRFTGNTVFQKLGFWSYSIYLWHWPLVVIIYYFSLNEIYIYFAIGLSVLFGFLSYKYIEKIKFPTFNNIKYIFLVKPLYMTIFVVIIGSYVWKQNGYLHQVPDEVKEVINLNIAEEGAYSWGNHIELDGITNFSTSNKKILIIGDSQAGDFINILVESQFPSDYELASKIISVDCGLFYVEKVKLNEFLSPLNNTQYHYGVDGTQQCPKQMERAFNSNLILEADYIFIAQYWRKEVLPYIPNAIEKLKKKTNAPIIIVGNKDILSKDSINIYYKAFITDEVDNLESVASKYFSQSTLDINKTIKQQSIINNFIFIDPSKAICSNRHECLVLNDNTPIFYNKNHTTKKGNELLAKWFEKQMEAIVN